MTASYLYLFIFILSLFSKEPVDGADEVFSITNILLACGITSICSRLDDLKRKWGRRNNDISTHKHTSIRRLY